MNKTGKNPTLLSRLLHRFSFRHRRDFRLFHVDSHDWDARTRNVLSDPDNQYIERVPDAGIVRADGTCTMHNGIRVYAEYYNEHHFSIVVKNKGVHEPQEERVFNEVLKDIHPGGSMIELGSYWAFYSLWFASRVPDAQVIMVEPDPHNLELGRRNFKLNGCTGSFVNGRIGQCSGLQRDSDTCRIVSVADLMQESKLSTLDILHADIQGYELDLINQCEPLLRKGGVRYVFLSTHSNRLHRDCKLLLERFGFRILASADLYESYCFDGVLVAGRPGLTNAGPINISSRRSRR